MKTHSQIYEDQLASRISDLRYHRASVYKEMEERFCPKGMEFEFSKFVDGLNYDTRRIAELQQLLHHVHEEGGEV